jgi:hypothetical protein
MPVSGQRLFSVQCQRWKESTPLGTVEAGAEGASQGLESSGLVMPEGMNDKEQAIWEKLRDGLGAIALEVRLLFISLRRTIALAKIWTMG